jgi:hypothetical protein
MTEEDSVIMRATAQLLLTVVRDQAKLKSATAESNITLNHTSEQTQ